MDQEYKTTKGLSNSAIKLIAVATMIIDHVAAFLLPTLVPATPRVIIVIMRIIGRISFPLYAFLLTEGYIHTRDRKRYGLGLLIFALISEIPWNLVNTGAFLYEKQNVFFTLFLGYFGICMYEKYKTHEGACMAWQAALLIVSYFLKADYGPVGYAVILLIYIIRERGWLRDFSIHIYNGERGFIKTPFLKYVFYAFYPLHLLLFYVLLYNK